MAINIKIYYGIQDNATGIIDGRTKVIESTNNNLHSDTSRNVAFDGAKEDRITGTTLAYFAMAETKDPLT